MLEELEIKDWEKGFRYQKNLVVGNMRTHVDKAKLEAMFRERINYPIKKMLLSHETADEKNPYLHTHFVVVIDVPKGKYWQSTNSRIFDIGGIHPWIDLRKGVSMKNLKDHWNYICKEDNKDQKMEEEKKFTQNERLEAVLNCEKGKEYETVLATGGTLGDINGAMNVAMKKKKVVMRLVPELTKEWQLELKANLQCKANKRKVVWYVDKIGGSGKSDFCKHMCRTDPKNYARVNGGVARDVGTLVEGLDEEGWTGHCLFIDIPRTAETHKDIYNIIESLKNGEMQVSKWKSRMIDLQVESCHVVIFANWEPNYSKLSGDRWIIKNLKGFVEEADYSKLESLVMIHSESGANVKAPPILAPAVSYGKGGPAPMIPLIEIK